MSSSASTSEVSASQVKGSVGIFNLGAKFETSENTGNGATKAESKGESEKEERTNSVSNAERSETAMTRDDIIVEGGHQHVAAILSDMNRAGFKSEFKDWLESIPQYPKGYDFKFGELSELLNINFETMFADMKEMKPCWTNKLTNGTYEAQVKDDKGDFKTKTFKCNFSGREEFVKQMDKRRLSLKRAIAVYADNKGQTGTDLTLPAGPARCEEKRKDQKRNIDYDTLTDGKSYVVQFKLATPIGNKISPDDTFVISFKESKDKDGSGRWVVSYGREPDAGQISKRIKKSDGNANTVRIKDVDFTLVSDDFATTLEWTEKDCKKNKNRFENLGYLNCTEDKNVKKSEGWQINIE